LAPIFAADQTRSPAGENRGKKREGENLTQ